MRVLAITANASLAVALGSMMRDWEVVTVRTVEEAAAAHSESVVALIDLGDSDEGLQIADELYRSGITIPSVVIGDRPVDHPHASVLTRPFSLEELGVAVREASVRVHEPATAASPPVPEPELPAEPEPEPVVEVPPPAARTPEEASPSRGVAVPARRPGERPLPTRPRPLSVVRPEPEPVEASEPESAPPEPEPVAVEPVPVEREIEEPAAEVFEQPEEVHEPQPAAHSAPAVREPEPEPVTAPEVVQRPRYVPPPQPAPVARPAAPAASTGVAAAAQSLVESAAARPLPQDDSAGRWRKRRRPARVVETEVEPPLIRRLKAAAAQLMDVEALVDELPVLEDLRALADGLVGEMEAQFSAPIASVFARGEDGFHAIAHRGLSRVEAGMVVAETQPLFSDVLQTQEGILIQPVDLAQGLVAGIGGSRTEALMAAPAVLAGQTVAIVVVGGDRFDEGDLDRLSDLAAEAAPGFAVALLLRKLRGND